MDYKILSDEIVDQLHENYKSAPERVSFLYTGDKHRKEIESQIRRAQEKRKDPAEVEKIFAGKDRIYIEMQPQEGREKSPTEVIIEHYLKGEKWVYGFCSSGENYGSYQPDPARAAEPKYIVTDYIKGYATDESGKQQYKIGKLIKHLPALLEEFNKDNMRMLYSGNLMIAMSRKCEDIANMSMGRNWSSCMSPNGSNVRYLPKEIENGSLIAYLVRKSDRDIEKPLARILIKPYFKMSEKERELSEVKSRIFEFNSKAARIANVFLPAIKPQEVYFQVGPGYGLSSYEFAFAVNNFVTKELNAGKQGQFHRAPEIYPDKMARSISREGKSTGFKL